jgi:hypothetical protein
MIERLRQDIAEAPEAFDLVGPVDPAAIDQTTAALGHPASEPLRELWSAIGGGDMFETEELLSPTTSGPHSLAEQNAELRRGGLPAGFLVFHRGLHMTAADPSGSLVALDPDTFDAVRRFDSLAEWYDDLRREYAATYGLSESAT